MDNRLVQFMLVVGLISLVLCVATAILTKKERDRDVRRSNR
jgi:hypothetical protein